MKLHRTIVLLLSAIFGFSTISLALASASFEFRELWHVGIWLLWLLLGLVFLPAFRQIESRLLFSGLVWGGAVSLWFISNPYPPHSAYPFLPFVLNITFIVLPAFILIVSTDWRNTKYGNVPSPSWNWAFVFTVFVWLNTFFDGTKNQYLKEFWNHLYAYFQASPLQIHQYNDHLNNFGRAIYFIIFAIIAWSLANRGQAGRFGRLFFTLGSCGVLALFEHLRFDETHWKAPTYHIYSVSAVSVLIICLIAESFLAPCQIKLPKELEEEWTGQGQISATSGLAKS